MLNTPLKFVKLNSWSIYRLLQVEELLLRNTKHNYCIINQGTPDPTVVMGFSAKPSELVELEATKRDAISVIRRFTGGGTVIVDHQTLFVTFIMNSSAVPCQPYPRNIMSWTEEFYQPVFQRVNQPDFRLREHDYVFGEKKIGGNAQTITKDRWVHHTSFLWNFTPKNMQYLKMPKKRPEYRGERSHEEFLTTLSKSISSIDDLTASIQNQCKSLFTMEELTEEDFRLHSKRVFSENSSFQPRTVIESL